MPDTTEDTRRELVKKINSDAPLTREQCEREHGQVWDTQELSHDFQVLGFAAPFVVVRRTSDDKKGSLMFTHRPRLYFNFMEDSR
jgi:hypothetical protein